MALTDKDLDAMKDLFKLTLKEENVATKEDIKHLPTKDEFYTETAKLYKNQEDQRIETDLLNHRVSKHSDQIERIEKHLDLPPTS